MTWAPRNKSEDEDEDEGDAARGKEESPDKAQEGTETSAEDEGERRAGGPRARERSSQAGRGAGGRGGGGRGPPADPSDLGLESRGSRESPSRWDAAGVGSGRGSRGEGAEGPGCHRRARAPAGISLHVDSLTDHSCSAESDGEKLPCRAGDPLCESGSECKDKYDDLEDDEDDDDEGERDLAPPKPVTSSPLTGVEAPLLSPPPEAAPRGGGGGKTPLGSRTSPGAPQPASKPKLWSLAEIATSDLKQPSLGPGCAPPGLPAAAAPASSGAPPGGSPYPASPLLGRHLYYTSPFYGNYTNYGNLNAALQGQGLLRYNSAAGAPGEALHAAPKAASDAGKAGAHPLEAHYRPPGGGYEPKKGRRPAARGAPGGGEPVGPWGGERSRGAGEEAGAPVGPAGRSPVPGRGAIPERGRMAALGTPRRETRGGRAGRKRVGVGRPLPFRGPRPYC